MGVAVALLMTIWLQAAPAKPSRIVSTTLVTDEISSALVDSSRIVAMSEFASDPATSNVSDIAHKINRFIGRNAEQIIALHPDVVLSTRYATIDLKEVIRQAQIPYQELTQFQGIADVEANIRLVAKTLGERDRGEELIRRMRTSFDLAGQMLPAERRTWRALYLAPGEWTAGMKTTVHEILIHAGMRDAAADAGITGNDKISVEKIIEINPDVIVIGTGYSRDADYARQLMSDPRLASLHAIEMRRVVSVPSRYLLTTSQFMGEGAVELGRRILALSR
jgi:iron complex transport system substrate-binding protein